MNTVKLGTFQGHDIYGNLSMAETVGRAMSRRIDKVILENMPEPDDVPQPHIEVLREYSDGARLAVNRSVSPRLQRYTLHGTAPAGTSRERMNELLADMEQIAQEL